MSIKERMEVKNRPFKVGQTLIIKGTPREDAKRFSINIGHNEDNYALHFNPRFYEGKVLMNSMQGGKWNNEPQLTGDIVPFEKGKEFKALFTFTKEEFQVIVRPEGTRFTFPNRLGDEEFTFLVFGKGVDVTVVRVDY